MEKYKLIGVLITTALLTYVSLSGCGLIHRNIESVATLTIETDSYTVKQNDTAIIRCKVRNKSKTRIEINDNPGCLISTWITVSETSPVTKNAINWREIFATDLNVDRLDTSLYISLDAAQEFIVVKNLFIPCGRPETTMIATDSTWIKYEYPCGDTQKYTIRAEFISTSTGYADGHYAAIGRLNANDITITAIPEKAKRTEEYVGKIMTITNTEDGY